MLKTQKEIALRIANIIDDKKGKDIRILNVYEICSFADYFVIASGTSTRQAKAIADEIQNKLMEEGMALGHKEGYNDGRWVLLDYMSVVVHLFVEEEREFYNLERVWKDAPYEMFDNI